MTDVSTPRLGGAKYASNRPGDCPQTQMKRGGLKKPHFDIVRKNMFDTPHNSESSTDSPYVETATSTHAQPLGYAPTPRRISFGGDNNNSNGSMNLSGDSGSLLGPNHAARQDNVPSMAKRSPLPLPDFDAFEEHDQRFTAKRHGPISRFESDDSLPLRPPSPPVKSPPTSRLFKHRSHAFTPAAQRMSEMDTLQGPGPKTEGGTPRRRGRGLVLDFGVSEGSNDDLLSDSLTGHHSGNGRGLFGSDTNSSIHSSGGSARGHGVTSSTRRSSHSSASGRLSLFGHGEGNAPSRSGMSSSSAKDRHRYRSHSQGGSSGQSRRHHHQQQQQQQQHHHHHHQHHDTDSDDPSAPVGPLRLLGDDPLMSQDVAAAAGGISMLAPGGSNDANDRSFSSIGSIEEGEEMDSLLHREFRVVDELGSGSFGHVLRVVSRLDGQAYAVKKSRRPWRGLKERESMLREVRTLVSLGSHPHVVKYHQAWQEKGYLYIQTELCERGSLKAWLYEHDVITEETLWNFLLDLSLGLKHIHDKGLVHMDIKPDNVFLAADGSLKIGDFGVTVQDGDWDDGGEGDSMYLAPELLAYNPTVNASADIFSLGCTMFEMAANIELPTSGPLWRKLRTGNIEFPSSAQCSADLRALICHMMDPIPDRRPRAKDILEHHVLKHYLGQRGASGSRWRRFLMPVLSATAATTAAGLSLVASGVSHVVSTAYHKARGTNNDNYSHDQQEQQHQQQQHQQQGNKWTIQEPTSTGPGALPAPGVTPKNLLGDFNTQTPVTMNSSHRATAATTGAARRRNRPALQVPSGSNLVASAPALSFNGHSAGGDDDDDNNTVTEAMLPMRHRYRFERSDSLQGNELLARMAAAAVKRETFENSTTSASIKTTVGAHSASSGSDSSSSSSSSGSPGRTFSASTGAAASSTLTAAICGVTTLLSRARAALSPTPVTTATADLLLIAVVLAGVPLVTPGSLWSLVAVVLLYIVGVLSTIRATMPHVASMTTLVSKLRGLQTTGPYSPRTTRRLRAEAASGRRGLHTRGDTPLGGMTADRVSILSRLIGGVVLLFHVVAGASHASLSLRLQHALLLAVILVLSHVLLRDATRSRPQSGSMSSSSSPQLQLQQQHQQMMMMREQERHREYMQRYM